MHIAYRQNPVDELLAPSLVDQRVLQPHGCAEHQGLVMMGCRGHKPAQEDRRHLAGRERFVFVETAHVYTYMHHILCMKTTAHKKKLYGGVWCRGGQVRKYFRWTLHAFATHENDKKGQQGERYHDQSTNQSSCLCRAARDAETLSASNNRRMSVYNTKKLPYIQHCRQFNYFP